MNYCRLHSLKSWWTGTLKKTPSLTERIKLHLKISLGKSTWNGSLWKRRRRTTQRTAMRSRKKRKNLNQERQKSRIQIVKRQMTLKLPSHKKRPISESSEHHKDFSLKMHPKLLRHPTYLISEQVRQNTARPTKTVTTTTGPMGGESSPSHNNQLNKQSKLQ